MSHNPRFTLDSNIKNVSISHRGRQVIHDSFLRNKLQITRPLYPTKTITYKQNALNQRVAKLVDGQVVEKYLWKDLTTLLAIYDKDDNLKQRFEYADQRMPISMTQNGQKYYLHYDQVGSLRAVSDTSHNIIKEITYDTYGNMLTDSNEAFTIPFGFAGGLYDADTKLTRFGYRDYDAYTGKWTAKDPIGFSGGDSNLYGHVWSDPVNWVDESGLSGALPWSTTITLPSLEWRLFYEAAKLGYQTGYDLAEWWDNYNDSSVTDDVACLAKPKQRLENEYTRDVKNKGLKDPCEYLRNLYRMEKDNVKRQKIKRAQKHFGCRPNSKTR